MNRLQHRNLQQCVCGKPLPIREGKGRKRRFCSAACKQQQYRNRVEEKRNAKHQIVYLLNAIEQVPSPQNTSSLQLVLQSGGICQGDAYDVLKTFPDRCIDMVMTSPPYFALRDYGVAGQIGLETTFDAYITRLCAVFDEVKRVLKDTGTCFVNIGDTYSGSGNGSHDTRTVSCKNYASREQMMCKYNNQKAGKTSLPDKSLCLIPFRFAIEMVNRGWILRNTIIWHKPNAMPENVRDRFTDDYEYLFFFVKSKHYYFDQQFEPYTAPMNRWGGQRLQAHGVSTWDQGTGQTQYRNRDMRPNPLGRNKRSVWSIPTKPFPGAHFAVYPPELCETPIKAGCPPDGVVLDPFMGSGTTCVVAAQLGRRYIGIELNEAYVNIAQERLTQASLSLVS